MSHPLLPAVAAQLPPPALSQEIVPWRPVDPPWTVGGRSPTLPAPSEGGADTTGKGERGGRGEEEEEKPGDRAG